MIITFATQKGGAGKTTLAIAFANYLALAGNPVRVHDFDFQKSIHTKWVEDQMLEKPILYEVEIPAHKDMPFADFDTMVRFRNDACIHIFDLAGTLDMRYTDILQYSDFIVIPFEYSDVSVKSTIVFINFLGLLESEAHKIFVMSRHEQGYNYPNKEFMDKEIGRFGRILNNGFLKRNALHKIDTRGIDSNLRKMVKPVFEEMLIHIEEKTGEKLHSLNTNKKD